MGRTKGSKAKKMKYQINYYHPEIDVVIHMKQFASMNDVGKCHSMSRNTFWKYIKDPVYSRKKKGFTITRIPNAPEISKNI